MGENVAGLSVRQGVDVALDAMHNMLRSVELPSCLSEIGITDRSKAKTWAPDAWNERRLLGRAPRDLTEEDIALIYENAFEPYK
jgi:alcohol dehydrogenase class IV